MKDLFYSEKEQLSFWVSGYDLSSYNCDEIVKYLLNYQIKACELFNINLENMFTYVIENSRRYKYMRVFYAKTDKAPQNAFVIDDKNDWTMDKWLKD